MCRRRRYGTNLPVQDLLTSQNDAFVTAELVGTNDDEDESAYYEKRETDTHWRCKATTKAGLFSCCKCFHACCCCCDEEPGRHEPDGPVTDANWNWRMKFDVELPMRDVRWYLKCWDKDVVSLNVTEPGDLIGVHNDTDNTPLVEGAEVDRKSEFP